MVMANGRLATTMKSWSGSRRVRKSRWTTLTLLSIATRARRRSTSEPSLSTATTWPAMCARGTHKAPSPAPISQTTSEAARRLRRTIHAVTAWSRRKCCPGQGRGGVRPARPSRKRRRIAATHPFWRIGARKRAQPAHGREKAPRVAGSPPRGTIESGKGRGTQKWRARRALHGSCGYHRANTKKRPIPDALPREAAPDPMKLGV